MSDLGMEEAGEEFERCWAAAGQHLEERLQGADSSWMRAHLSPPFLEHISFRIGNQLVFVRLEDVDGTLAVPGSIEGLERIAAACEGSACVLPMRQQDGRWAPAEAGWGLLDARTRAAVTPPDLVTDADVEMSVWELQDCAVNVVRRALEQQGREVVSWQADPELHPAIWFIGDSGLEWVVVGFARYPQRQAHLPPDIDEIAAQWQDTASRGHFASVALASAGEAEGGAEDGMPLPLLRGRPLMVAFDGLTAHNPGENNQGSTT
ncbi:MAG: hypothetical protein U1F30_02290 [Steroidobacteraceae bacterium]